MAAPGEEVRSLISATRAGEPEAMDRLLERYRNYLRLLARASIDPRLQAKVDASDAVQETMLKAYRGFGEFRGETEREFAAWLRRILGNSLKNLHRRFRTAGRRVGREQSLDDLLQRSSLALHKLLPAAGSSPSRRAVHREMGLCVADALAELGPDDRDVIVLRSLQGLTWPVVGECMGRTADAARVLWARALRRLGARIEEEQWSST